MQNWYHFFLKYLVEFHREDIWDQTFFFSGKIFNYKFKHQGIYRAIGVIYFFVNTLWQFLIFKKFFFFNFFFCFLGPHPRHIEVPRLWVQQELQLLAYTTATATSDLSCVCNLYHSSQQHCILNPLSEAKDRTCNLMVPSQICFHCAKMGTPSVHSYSGPTANLYTFSI